MLEPPSATGLKAAERQVRDRCRQASGVLKGGSEDYGKVRPRERECMGGVSAEKVSPRVQPGQLLRAAAKERRKKGLVP